ncbi:MAG: cation diffusion facilitator family transporter [Clostridia bacterium]|jgi:cation diffusion facilitator family transporter
MENIKFRKVKMVLLTILFVNLAVAALKIIIGSSIHSASMTADGFHSLTDGSSNIIGLIGVYFASKSRDEKHPYGHGKFETLAGLVIGGMLLVLGGKIVMDAIHRFFNPKTLQVSFESLIVLIATLLVNIFVSAYEYNQGKKLNSTILISDSLHTRSDIFVSLGVLITLACIKLGLPPIIDPIASLVVSGFILHASWEIFRSVSGVLVDRAVVGVEEIKEIIMEFDTVKDVHDIRSRGNGDDLYIDMHVMTEPDMSVEQSHALTHEIEDRIQEEVSKKAQVIVHLEPYYD